MPEVTAIVPIRKNSERLPNKNFRDFNGQPLYYWIFDTLRNVDEVDRVVVNTDSEEIITKVPEEFDVEISERPKRFFGDDTTQNIVQYEVDRLESDIYLQTFCTNPLLRSDSVAGAVQKFVNEPCDSLFTVTRHQSRMFTSDFTPINHNTHNRIPTQELSPIYEDNSNVYLFTKKTLDMTGDRVGLNYITYELGKIESIDIDTKEDFEMARYFHKRKQH
jgi:CMP-N-acetylneuraminic acid synthetase